MPRSLREPRRSAALALACGVVWIGVSLLHGDGFREFTVTGCLLSNGYAGFLIEDAVIDAIDGQPADASARANGPVKWLLDGGGNLRRRVGEKVQVMGRSDWRADAKDEAPGTPHLEVASITTIAASCK